MLNPQKGVGRTTGQFQGSFSLTSRHIIPWIRGASAYIRRQTITNSFVRNAEDKRNRLPQAIMRGFVSAREKAKVTRSEVERCFMDTGLNEQSLLNQGKLMEEFYLRPKSTSDDRFHDEQIFETLTAMKLQDEYFNMITHQPINFVQTAVQELGDAIPARAALGDKLEKLLHNAGQTLNMWYVDGTTTDRYREHEKCHTVRQFRKVRDELWKALAQRTFQLERLHNSSTHGLPPTQMTRAESRNP
jgi:hypothetical protein